MSTLALWRPQVNAVYEWDALGFLRQMETGSVNLIATDPPYMGVKDAAWDNQWATDADYLDWLRDHLREMRRVLAPNGSLYLFASPRMAARVEIAVGEYFNVLNSIVWAKSEPPKVEKYGVETFRGYVQMSERIIFAEPYRIDWGIKEEMFTPITKYMRDERDRLELSNEALDLLCGWQTKAFHFFAQSGSNFSFPTAENYLRLQNKTGGFMKPYTELVSEYRALHQQYEDLRRPFNASPFAPYTDVWTFATVQHYDGKHECEKPLSLMRHIVTMSSRPGDVVLDCFCGSGATLDAARREGRRYIGCDMSAHWAAYARKRVALPFTLGLWDTAATRDDVRGA